MPAFQKRLREKLADLLRGAGIEPQRLAQEAALLADRSDIGEELMRLRRTPANWRACWTATAKSARGWISCCRR